MLPLFMLGCIVTTPGALDAINDRKLSAIDLLLRHQRNQSDALDAGDLEANRLALIDGSRIFSSFEIGEGDRIFIITSAQDDKGRRSTTILLATEY